MSEPVPSPSREDANKSAGIDPSAAPLGTVEETGAPSPSDRLDAETRTWERQGRSDAPRPNAATPQLTPDASLPSENRTYSLAILIGVAAAAILALVFYMLI